MCLAAKCSSICADCGQLPNAASSNGPGVRVCVSGCPWAVRVCPRVVRTCPRLDVCPEVVRWSGSEGCPLVARLRSVPTVGSFLPNPQETTKQNVCCLSGTAAMLPLRASQCLDWSAAVFIGGPLLPLLGCPLACCHR